MVTIDDSKQREARSGRLIVGGVLLVVGALLLAAELGLDVPVRVWSWWPLVPLALGLSRAIFSTDAERRRGAYWLIVVGVWGAVCVLGLFGLDWGSSWPIWLMAVGLRVVLDGVGRSARRQVRDAT
jgi:hypothetical protein